MKLGSNTVAMFMGLRLIASIVASKIILGTTVVKTGVQVSPWRGQAEWRVAGITQMPAVIVPHLRGFAKKLPQWSMAFGTPLKWVGWPGRQGQVRVQGSAAIATLSCKVMVVCAGSFCSLQQHSVTCTTA